MIQIKKISLNNTEIFLCMLWGKRLLSYITAICLQIPGLNLIAWGVVPFIISVAFILSCKDFIKRIRIGDISFYLVCAIVYVGTYAFFPQNSEYLDESITLFLFSALPFVFVGRAMNIEKLDRPFYIISLLIIFTGAINVLFLEAGERKMSEYQYDMYSAYVLLPHVLMVLWHFMRRINIIDMAAALIGLFVLMGYGTRGPLLCVAVFVGLYLLFGIEGRKKWWYYVLIAIVVYGLYFSFSNLLEWMDVSIGRFGLSSRIVNAYEQDMLDDDSGRGFIRNKVIQALSTSGPLGLGICGDRAAAGQYSHNIIYEFWASFGYIFGSLLLGTIVIFIFKAWRNCKTLEERGFLLLLVGAVVQLFVSNSFLHSSHFYLLLGYCARLVQSGQVRNETDMPVNVFKP